MSKSRPAKPEAFPCRLLPQSTSQPDIARLSDMELMLKGYGLTTARFFYRMPDFRHVLNEFIWQFYDLAPDHPTLMEKVEWWQAKIEGPLHSVSFTHRKLISPGEWRQIVGEFPVH